MIEAAPTIGGGTRTSELTLPGLLHDDCSASHPFAPGSPALTSLGLERHGLEWAWPEVEVAHPFDDGSAAAMLRSIEETAAGLGSAGRAWKRLFGSSSAHFDALSEDIMRPLAHLPRHPLAAGPLRPARRRRRSALLARTLPTPQARALFGGTAAHSFSPFSRPFSSAAGMALTCACHRNGWPVARGGSQAIADALAAVVREHGGRIETGRPVRSLDELPAADAVVLDLAPGAVVEIAGERLPRAGRARLPPLQARPRRLQGRPRGRGRGALDGDPASAGPGPSTRSAPSRRSPRANARSTAAGCRSGPSSSSASSTSPTPRARAATSTRSGPTPTSRTATRATRPRRCSTRSNASRPGLRERILARHVRSPADLESYNPNYVGGDIITGANTPLQSLFRPASRARSLRDRHPRRLHLLGGDPARRRRPRMNGYNAAQSVAAPLCDAPG